MSFARSRFPRGKRGLKFRIVHFTDPSWNGRFPRGKRGLKSSAFFPAPYPSGRFPRGKRGLKFVETKKELVKLASLPPREAWIEI